VKLLEYVHLGIPVIAPRLLAIQYYFGEDQVCITSRGCGRTGRLYPPSLCGSREAGGAGAEERRVREEFPLDTLKFELFKVIDECLGKCVRLRHRPRQNISASTSTL